MSDSVVEIQNLGKSYRLYSRPRWRVLDLIGFPVPATLYKEICALRDLNLTIPAGQRIGIVGRNGAGKSTLLKLIAGLLVPTTGKVKVRGRVQVLMDVGTGFHPEFTGRQNVFASLGYQGVTGRLAETLFGDIVEFSELEEVIGNPLRTYSAGMQARLAFAVSTAIQPDILIIDEVLSAGDAYFIGKCMNRIQRLTLDRGATVLIVSHDVNSIQALCDRVIWLKEGRLYQDGDPLTVSKSYYQDIQAQENLRLRKQATKVEASRFQSIRRQASSETACSPGTGIFRVFLLPDPCGFEQAPRVAFVGLKDRYNHFIFRSDIGVCESSEMRRLGNGAWGTAEVVQGVMSRAICVESFEELPGFELGVPLGKDELFRDNILVLKALPSLQSRIKVLIEENKELVPIGEILPQETLRWQEYAFDLDIVTNLHSSGPDDPQVLSTKSVVTWEVPDPRIEAVRFVDLDGKTLTGIQEGDPLVVEVHYYSSRVVESPVFGMSIYLPDGRPFCRALNTLGGASIPHVHGRGVVYFQFSPFYGGPGEYIVSASIFKRFNLSYHEPSAVYDTHDRSYRFRVWKELGVVLDMGLVRVPFSSHHVPRPLGESNPGENGKS